VCSYVTADRSRAPSWWRKLGQLLSGGDPVDLGSGLFVYQIPSRAGFAQIEEVFTRYAGAHPTVQWSYGNVYDARGEPLNWWLQ
jgi:hypothetical protein